jgi:hypothetical protein
LFTGCPEKPEEEEESGEDRIAAEYQGKFSRRGTGTMVFYIELKKDQIIFSQKSGNSSEGQFETFPAWTDGNDLWANVSKDYTEQYVDGKPDTYWAVKSDYKLGTFTDNDTISVFYYMQGGFSAGQPVNFTRMEQ